MLHPGAGEWDRGGLGSAPLGGDLAGQFGNDVSEHGERLPALFGGSPPRAGSGAPGRAAPAHAAGWNNSMRLPAGSL